jgi:hypothetical protein
MTRAFNVYRNGRNIDTVFYNNDSPQTPEDVRKSLINHDGYPMDITVSEAK